MGETKSSTTEAESVASMRGADFGRIDENGKPVSTDAQLKESSANRASSTTAAPATARDDAAPTTAVGTSGTTPARHLPGTASPLPFLALLSGLSLAGALGVRAARQSAA